MTDELKKALEAAKTDDEMHAVAREYGYKLKILSDEELDKVAGGIYFCDAGCEPLNNGCYCEEW